MDSQFYYIYIIYTVLEITHIKDFAISTTIAYWSKCIRPFLKYQTL